MRELQPRGRWTTWVGLGMVLLAGAPARAADIRWISPGGGNWNTAASWEGGVVPGAADNAIVDVAGTFTITVNVAASVAALTISNPDVTLRLVGQSITLSGPSTAGALYLQGGVVSGAGPLVTTGSVTVYAGGNSIAPPWTNRGAATLTGQYYETAALTAGGGITNEGTLTLTVNNPNGSAASLGGGTLVNSGTLRTQGSGGGRYIGMNITNEAAGTVTLGASTDFNRASGTYINRGAWTDASAVTASFTGAAQVFEQQSGTLTVTGAHNLVGDTFRMSGGSVTGSVQLVASTLESTGVGTASFLAYQASTVRGTLGPTQAVTAVGQYYETATLTAADGLINQGSIYLTCNNPNGCASVLSITGGALSNTGLIQTSPGSGGGRYIRGSINNDGNVVIAYSTTFDGGGAQLRNRFSWTINSGATMTVAGASQAFLQSGGVLAINGAFTMSGATFNFGGGVVAGTASLFSSALVDNAAGDGRFNLYQGCSFSGNVTAGQVLTIVGGYYDPATLTSAMAFINAGTIQLTCNNPNGCGATLAVTSGALTNEGTLITVPGSGGSRTIAASVINNGVASFTTDTVLAKAAGVFETHGTVSISAGTTLSMSGAAQVFRIMAGEVDIDGALVLSSVTTEMRDGMIAGTAQIYAGTLDLTALGAAAFLLRQGVTFRGAIAAGQTVRVRGEYWDPANMTTVADLPNDGLLQLEGGNPNGTYSMVTLNSGGRLLNRGTFNINSANGGGRYLRGHVTNTGSFSSNDALTYDRAGAEFINLGSVTFTSGGVFYADAGSQQYRQRGGTTAGSVRVTNGTLEVSGGAITSGNGIIEGGTLVLAAPSSASIYVRDGVTLQGDVGPDHVVHIRGEYYRSTTLTASAAFVNDGTIWLETGNSNGNIATLAGPQVTNHGMLHVSAANAAGRQLLIGVVNEPTGTVLVDQDTPLRRAGFTHVNRGTWSITSGVLGVSGSTGFSQEAGTLSGTNGWSLQQSGGTFALLGGTMAPPMSASLASGTLRFADGATGSVVTLDGCTLATDVFAGQSIWVTGQYYAPATLTGSLPNTSNAGSITLRTNNPNGSAATLNLPGTLTNSGLLNVWSSGGGGRSVVTELLNTGEYRSDDPVTLGRSGANHVNRGLIRQLGGTSTTFSGASFRNEAGGRLRGAGTLGLLGATPSYGSIEPGDTGTGTLTLSNATVTQQPAHAFKVRIGGTAAGQWDRVTVSGGMAVDGTLEISLVNGFVPAVGNAFTLATCNPCTGRFTTLVGTELGLIGAFDIEYNATSIVARVRQLPDFLVQPSTTTPRAGVPFDVTLTARDPNDVTLTDYAGTALFSASAADAALPSVYTFNAAADLGVKTFSQAVTFYGAGQQWLRVVSGENLLMRGEAVLQVQPNDISLSLSTVSAVPASLEANAVAVTRLTVTPKDAYGNRLGAGRAVVISATGGTLLGSVTDAGDGTYTQDLRAPLTTGSATVSATVDSVAINATATVNFVADVTAPQPVVLSATTTGSSVVDLTWTASASADTTGYEITRTISGAVDDVSTVAAATVLQVTGLSQCTPYDFEVRALDAAGNRSAVSNRVRATTHQDGPPAAPTLVTAAGYDAYAVVQFVPAAACDVVRTELARSTTTGGPYTVVASSVTGAAYTDVPLVNGTPYYWVLRAVDTEDLTGPDSNEATATPLDAPAPEGVTGLLASSLAGGSIRLTWGPPAVGAAVRYRVYRAAAAITDVTTATLLTTVTATTHTDLPATDGTYHYTVTWLDLADNESLPHPSVSAVSDRGGPSAALSIVGATAPLGVGTFTVRAVVSETLSGLPALRVRLPGGGAPVDVVLGETAANTYEGTFDVPADTAAGNATFTWSGVDTLANTGTVITSGATVAVDGRAPSASITTQPATPVRAGLLLVNVTTSESLGAAPTLSLTTAGGANHPIMLAGAGTTWSAPFNVTAATGDGVATFAFAAADAAGNAGTAITSGGTLVIDTTAPEAPGNVAVAAGFQGALRVSWTAPTNETSAVSYAVYRSDTAITDVSALTPVATGVTALTVDDQPPADGTWFYAVVATDAAGNVSPVSASASGYSDQLPPEAPTLLTATVNGAVVTLAWTAPAEAGVTFAVFRSTATLGGSVATLTPLQQLLPGTTTTDLPGDEGDWFYVVTSVDAVGLLSVPSNEVTARVDLVAPRISISGVEDGVFRNGDVTPVVTVTDLTLDTVDTTLDGQAYTSGAAVTAEGAHTLSVTARDQAGHASTMSLTFTIDLTAPVVQVRGVVEGTTYHAAVVPRVTGTDANLVNTTVTLDGRPFTNGAIIETDGSYTLVGTAYDKAGNSATETVHFTVDLPPAAVASAHAVQTDREVRVSWAASTQADVVSYVVQRNGVQAYAGTALEAVAGAPPSTGELVSLDIRAVDGAGQEGAARRILLHPVRLVLSGYGTALEDGTQALTHDFFDTVRFQLANDDAESLELGPLDLWLFDYEGNQKWAAAGTDSWAVGALDTAAVTEVVPTHADLVGPDNRMDVKLVLPGTAGSTAEYRGSFAVRGRFAPGASLEAVHGTLMRGTEGTVSMRVTNHGSADLQLVNWKPGGSDEMQVRLLNPDLSVLVSEQVTDNLSGVLSGNRRVTTLGPGQTWTFAPVTLVIPPSAPDNVILELVTAPTHHGLGTADALEWTGLRSSRVVSVVPPPWLVTATTDKAIYQQGETVYITGVATLTEGGAVAADVPVKLVVSWRGFRRTHFVRTDANGAYAFPFTAAPTDAGLFTVSATHPSVVVDETDATFIINGLELTPGLYRLTLVKNSGWTVPFAVRNLGQTPLTGVTFTLEDAVLTDGVTATTTASVPATLGAGATVNIPVDVNAALDAAASANFTLRVTTAEGLERTSRLEVSLFAAEPIPRFSPQYIQLGMVAGTSELRSVTVTNEGYDTWKNFRLVGPSDINWATVPTGRGPFNLDPGQSTSFDVLFMPPAGTTTGSTITAISFQSDNHAAMDFPMNVRVTTDAAGNADIKVTNLVYALTDPGRPIPGATVTLRSLEDYTRSHVMQSAADGHAVFTGIPAGHYQYWVRASGFKGADNEGAVPDHGELTILPDRTVTLEVGLVETFVDVSWTVTPTTIQDQYDIEVQTTFETTVPVPVIQIVPARITFNLVPGDTATGQIEIFNLGLVSSWDLELNLAQDHYLDVQFSTTRIAELPARSSIVVPYTVHLRTHGSPPPTPCTSYSAEAYYDWKWFCTTGGFWEQRQTLNFDIQVRSQAAKVGVQPNPVVRTMFYNCPGFENGNSEVPPEFTVTSGEGGNVEICDCGRVTTAGIGLPTLSSLLDQFVGEVTGKLNDYSSKVLQQVGVPSWDDIQSGAAEAAGQTAFGADWPAVKEAKGKLDALKGRVDQAAGYFGQAMDLWNQSTCESQGLADNMHSFLQSVANEAADAVLNQALNRVTGGLLAFNKAYSNFDSTCLGPGQTAHADVPQQSSSFGLGTMGFSVALGCGAARTGSCCPVTVTYVDYTVICTPFSVSSSQMAGGGSGGGGGGGGGGFGGFGGGGGGGGGGPSGQGVCTP